MAGSEQNWKSYLNMWLQKALERPVTKEDALYEVAQVEGGFQATLTLPNLNGEAYAGEPCNTKKEAEQSAAEICLQANDASIPEPKKPKQGASPAALKASAKAQPAAKGAPGGKGGCQLKGKSWGSAGGPDTYGQYGKSAPIGAGVGKGASGCKGKAAPAAYGAHAHAYDTPAVVAKGKKGAAQGKGGTAAAPGKGAKSYATTTALDRMIIGGSAALNGRPGNAAVKKPQTADSEKINYKMQLNTFIQRVMGRPLTKPDIEFEVFECEGGFQAKITIRCLPDEPAFIGEVAPEKKEAEQAATYQALAGLGDEVDSVLAQPSGKKRKAAPGSDSDRTPLGLVDAAAHEAMVNNSKTPKFYLNEALAKIRRQVNNKGDISYLTEAVEGGYQSTVTIHVMPDDRAGEAWNGWVCPDKKSAEHSAAEVALASIREVEDFVALIDAERPEKRPRRSDPDEGV